MPGQGLVGAREPQWAQLVQRRHRPEMGMLDQPGGDVVDERIEHFRDGALADSWLAVAAEVGMDGLAVMAGVSGDLAARDSLPVRRAISLLVIPCRCRAWMFTLLLSESMSVGPPWKAGEWPETIKISGGPPRATERPRVGNLGDYRWGYSASVITSRSPFRVDAPPRLSAPVRRTGAHGRRGVATRHREAPGDRLGLIPLEDAR
jgi:hypothetical protein